jgi:hypothetical protein
LSMVCGSHSREPLQGEVVLRIPLPRTPLNKGKKREGRSCYTPALDDSLLGPLLQAEGLGHLLREVSVVVHYLLSVRFATVDVRHTPVDAYRLLSDARLAMLGAQSVGSILAYGNHSHLI